MESYSNVPTSLSSSSHGESGSSTQRKRERKEAKKNPRTPLYKLYNERSKSNMTKKERNSIEKSKRCKDYREGKKQQEFQALKENAVLKEQLKQKTLEVERHEQTISQQATQIQQQNATIEFQRLCIVENEKELVQKEQEKQKQSQTIQTQHQRIGVLIDLLGKLQLQNQQSVGLVFNNGPTSISMDQAENTLDVGNGENGQAWMKDSVVPDNNFQLERPDQSTCMLDRLEQGMEPEPESSIMREMRTSPLCDLEPRFPEIELEESSSLFN